MAKSTVNPMEMFGNAFGALNFLAEKADEREYLKRLSVQVTCTVLKDSDQRNYSTGPRMGQTRGHQTNLSTEEGDILQDILLDYPVTKGETVVITTSLLVPDRFLEGKVKMGKDGVAAVQAQAGRSNPSRPSVPGPDATAVKP